MLLQSDVALFSSVRSRYPQIFVIVSPPRCSSTAFARVFWEHPSIRYYSHEPFEITYYDEAELAEVQQKLLEPLDLKPIKPDPILAQGENLVIKEMPYQVWDHFALLAQLGVKPIIFLIRDPRINIASRMNKKLEVGDAPLFPKIETGWQLLFEQVQYCQEENVPYLLVDGADFRNQPAGIFPQIFAELGLDFFTSQLSWASRSEVDLDNLGGAHRHLYDHVLNSKGMEPDTEIPPSVSWFPKEEGFRAHVGDCMDIYQTLRQDSSLVRA